MSNLNVCTITGRLVRDPEVRFSASGVAVNSFCLAVNRNYQDKNKQWQEERAFVPCTAFGRHAEQLAQKHKGDTLLIVGRLRTDAWEQNGVSHNRLVLVVENIQFVEAPPRTAPPGPSGPTDVPPSDEVSRAVPF